MTEQHKKARIQAIQAAFNLKGTVYLNKKLSRVMAHNFTGKSSILETIKYESGKVTVYDAENKKIETIEGKKAKGSSKLRNPADEKTS